jgi:hypothetical protein
MQGKKESSCVSLRFQGSKGLLCIFSYVDDAMKNCFLGRTEGEVKLNQGDTVRQMKRLCVDPIILFSSKLC